MEKMLACIYDGTKELEIKEITTPDLDDNEVLIKVIACGFCGTDFHYIEHSVPTFKKPPIILGHEIVGEVIKIGKRVSRVKYKDNVLIPAVFNCGVCINCRTGRGNICNNMVMLGNHINGGFAQYVKVPNDKDLCIVPKNIGKLKIEDICVIADALTTPYHAVYNRAKVKPSDKVVIVGQGGIGINLTQFSKVACAEILAIDKSDARLESAKTFGADHVLNSNGEDLRILAKKVKEIFNPGADIVFEAIGKKETIEFAFSCLRPGGTLVLVGFCPETASLKVGNIMFYEMRVMGSLGCPPEDYSTVLQMAIKEQIKVKELITDRISLKNINIGLEHFRKEEGIRTIVLPWKE
jgi:6-hydroxycyclohex-1-ene-1-carbonyl-CoA dehydrogenase